MNEIAYVTKNGNLLCSGIVQQTTIAENLRNFERLLKLQNCEFEDRWDKSIKRKALGLVMLSNKRIGIISDRVWTPIRYLTYEFCECGKYGQWRNGICVERKATNFGIQWPSSYSIEDVIRDYNECCFYNAARHRHEPYELVIAYLMLDQ